MQKKTWMAVAAAVVAGTMFTGGCSLGGLGGLGPIGLVGAGLAAWLLLGNGGLIN